MDEVGQAASQRLATLLEARDIDAAQVVLQSRLDGKSLPLREVLNALYDSVTGEAWLTVANALVRCDGTADGMSRLGDALQDCGAVAAAQVAQRLAGLLDFEAEPEMDVWGGAFNGQERRQAIVEQIITALGVVAIVETGTFRGTSTAYLAKFGLPLHSCELHPRYFHYASQRLAKLANLRLAQSDSRVFLRGLFEGGVLPKKGIVLFYLDAHWESDLPLWEELDLIFAAMPDAVVMVDDFRVPNDPGFSYDDYGRGNCLSVSNLYEAARVRPSLFFPNHPSAQETGARRGSIVLAMGETARTVARLVPLLAELPWDQALSYDGVADVAAKVADVAAKVADVTAKVTDVTAKVSDVTAKVTDVTANVATITGKVADVFATLHSETETATAARADTKGVLSDMQVQVALVRDELRLQASTQHIEMQLALADVKAMVRTLYDEIHSARAEAQRIAKLENYIERLRYTRWRHLGLRLRLEKNIKID